MIETDGHLIVDPSGDHAGGVYTVASMNSAHPLRAEYQLLFTAAPDLLAALKHCVARMPDLPHYASLNDEKAHGAMVDAAYAAIAKAEGR